MMQAVSNSIIRRLSICKATRIIILPARLAGTRAVSSSVAKVWPQFGGPEGVWSPETMLSATVANCFVLSFRAIARASKFEWTSLECDVDGVLERPERSTFFTAFNIHAVLHVPDGSRTELAQRLLEKSEKICLITASLKAEITLTTNIQVD